MANYRAIHLVGSSLVKYLTSVLPTDSSDPLSALSFRLVSSGELNGPTVDFQKTVTLWLYRVTVDPYTRNLSSRGQPGEGLTPLSLNLHYMFTVWADAAQDEQLALAWLLRQLHQHEALSPSDLIPDADWDATDIIQLVPSEITVEDMMRIWDAIDPGYRLSLSYTARVVRIGADTAPDARNVVARRFNVGNQEPGA